MFTSICRLSRRLQVRNMATVATTLFEDTGLVGDGSVALTLGAPGERHLAKVANFISKAEEHTKLSHFNKHCAFLQYGPKQGSPRFREQVAKFLSEGYGGQVNSDEITVTSGATHGLHLVGSVLLPPKAVVFVEDPTYFIAINILRDDLGLTIVPVPTDENGMKIDVLEKLIEEHKNTNDQHKKTFSSMIYVVPTYNNPRGYHIPPERCSAIVNLARKHDILVFCDDVYNLLHFDASTKAPPRLLTYDLPSHSDYKDGNVLSNGSFSKIMAPGLRLGWIEAGPRITSLCKNNNVMWSAGSANHYTSEIVASALELGLEQKYLVELNKEYQTSVAALCSVLKEKLPSGCTFNYPKGGYFIWIEMPEKAVAAEVAAIAAKKHDVKVLQGQMCSPTGKYSNCIRISFSHYPEDVLVKSAERVCAAISEHLQST